jgi:hypothetical protein
MLPMVCLSLIKSFSNINKALGFINETHRLPARIQENIFPEINRSEILIFFSVTLHINCVYNCNFPILWKFSPIITLLFLFFKKRTRLMRLPCALCVCYSTPPPPPINFWMPEPICMKVGIIYHGTWACLIGILHKFLPSVCVSPYRC